MGEHRALPTIASQLPLVFEDGARWETITGYCNDCDGPIPTEGFRGHVTRPFGGAYLIEAWGFCAKCDVLSHVSYRFLPDMSVVGRSSLDGQWSVWPPIRAPWWKRLLGLG